MIRFRMNIPAKQTFRDKLVETIHILLGSIRIEPGCTDCLFCEELQDHGALILETTWRDKPTFSRYQQSEIHSRLLVALDMFSDPPEICLISASEKRDRLSLEKVQDALEEINTNEPATAVSHKHSPPQHMIDEPLGIRDHEASEQSESEERFREAFEQTAIGITHVTADGRFLRINQRFLDIVGYNREELLRQTCHEITHPDDLSADMESVKQILIGEISVYSKEKRYLHKDGSVVWAKITVSLARKPDGDANYLISVVEDISRQKQTERELGEVESKFRSIVDNIGIGVGLISTDMKILELNRQMREWFPAIDLEDHPICYQAFNNPPLESPCSYCPTIQTLQDGQCHEAMKQAPQKDTVKNYRITSTPILDEEGEVTAAIEMVEDVTERMLLEAQLRQSQKLESVGTLASGVAHEINNPIMGAINYAELILDEVDANSQIGEYATQVRLLGQRIGTTVKALLSFSCHGVNDHYPVRIGQAIENVLVLFNTLNLRDAIDLEVDIPEFLPEAECNSQQIQQVILNLLTNARDALNQKYSDRSKEKKIHISAKQIGESEPRIAGSLPPKTQAESSDWIRITIEDNGTGIPASMLERVFDPFYTTKDQGKGTGLGLAISHNIAKEHDGRLSVESEVGEYTRFHLDLPAVGTRTKVPPVPCR